MCIRDRAEEGGGVERARAHLCVVGLPDHASVGRPEALQAEKYILKGGFIHAHNDLWTRWRSLCRGGGDCSRRVPTGVRTGELGRWEAGGDVQAHPWDCLLYT